MLFESFAPLTPSSTTGLLGILGFLKGLITNFIPINNKMQIHNILSETASGIQFCSLAKNHEPITTRHVFQALKP